MSGTARVISAAEAREQVGLCKDRVAEAQLEVARRHVALRNAKQRLARALEREK